MVKNKKKNYIDPISQSIITYSGKINNYMRLMKMTFLDYVFKYEHL